MPLVKLTDSCYAALVEMKKELKEQKKAKGQPTKTTLSECVCLLLKNNGKLNDSKIPLIQNELAQDISLPESHKAGDLSLPYTTTPATPIETTGDNIPKRTDIESPSVLPSHEIISEIESQRNNI